MKVTIRESSVVKPAEETPKGCLWMSNIDRLFSTHTQVVYFYRRPALTEGSASSSSGDFFNSTVLKDGLSKALVEYYPLAGRLKRNESGRPEIDCTGEGAIFIEAETDSCIEDLGDFTPNEQVMPLIPKLDNNGDISLYPPFLAQVTHFKCGGVCVSISLSHTVADGVPTANFVNRWSDLCRGSEDTAPHVPFFDRTILRARNPLIVSFPHIEYRLPSINIPSTSPLSNPKIATAKFNISSMQADQLKSKCNKNGFRFSTYEVILGYLWRCSCKARELKDDQETAVVIPVDGRSRTTPPLPDGFFGNAGFFVTPTALSGNIVSKPLRYAVNVIHETLVASGNNEYFRSAIDFMEIHPNIRLFNKGIDTFRGCNLYNTTWARLPVHGADFGWGRPFYMGPGVQQTEAGRSVLIANPPESGGGFTLIISLESDYNMNLFKECFYATMPEEPRFELLRNKL